MAPAEQVHFPTVTFGCVEVSTSWFSAHVAFVEVGDTISLQVGTRFVRLQDSSTANSECSGELVGSATASVAERASKAVERRIFKG